jgi:hypothetical protein
MAVTLNASTSSGLVQTADTSGNIELQNNGTTRLTVNSSGATIPTATVTTLKEPSGVLATQNGMTGIAKAWVNFNGTGTVAIRDSFNVSSITDNGTGDYTVNFTTALPNANYCVNSSTQAGSGATTDIYPFTQNNGSGSYQPVNPTASSFRVTTAQAGSFADLPFALIAVFSS